MVLSARVVRDLQVVKYCQECGWPIFSQMLKLYGMAHLEEKPHNLFFHPDCAISTIDISQEPKIEKALAEG